MPRRPRGRLQALARAAIFHYERARGQSELVPSSPIVPEFEPVTAWHRWEFSLTRLPQGIDIVIIQRTGETVSEPRKIHSVLDDLAVHTLIEHKGPTDKLTAEDACAESLP